LESMQSKWAGLPGRARNGLVLGLLLIVVLVGALAYWAYRPDYQVLFADMVPRDAAAMTSELDKLKVPYHLGDGGNTILVPRDLVYKTRLSVMGKDVPLQGAVGFEVFNNADFGMTEFVQKVNYLRAVQGELTRTILSIEDVQAARVHLAIPEQGLFKKALTKPKAAVTLTLKRGRVLAPEQVTGIQRLVAASVPDIVSADVTVLDQHGVALTRLSNGEAAGEGASGQLESKRSTEEYLVKKVAQVLDRTFGAGEALATVDVLLNLDQSKITTEEVLPAKGTGGADGGPTGVVVRERHTVRDADTAQVGAGAKAAAGTSTGESDYQVGRRVEQVAVASGTVKRMTIAVVVRQPMSDEQREKLREVVSLAVGFNAQRGDAIVVNSMDKLATPVLAATLPATPDMTVLPAAPAGRDAASVTVVIWVLAGLAGLLMLALVAWLLVPRRRAPARIALDLQEREKMLLNVRAWIDAPPVALEKA
jgi:flagellar M-ring protein FliF